jgi:hypothetical protein
MITIAKAIRQILIEEHFVSDDSTANWYCTISYLPDGQGVRDNIVTITDTEGSKDGRIMRTGEVIIHPGFQIRVRCTDYNLGYSKILAIGCFLDTLVNRIVSISDGGDKIETLKVTAVSKQSGIMPMGLESAGRRYHFSLNYTGTVKS